MYVPLSLPDWDGSNNSKLLTLCAITNKLTEGVEVLFTPKTLQELKRVENKVAELATRLVEVEGKSLVEHGAQKRFIRNFPQ